MQYVPELYKNPITLLLASFSFFTGGCAGLVTVVRRELYQGPVRIGGKSAVVMGLLLTSTGWIVAVACIVRAATLIPGV